MYERSSFSTSSPVFVGVTIFYSSLSDRCVLISFYFNLYFPNGSWYWTFFHVLICLLYIFFSDMSVHVFCPFSNWAACLFVFYSLNFENSLYMLDAKSFVRYVVCKHFLPVCNYTATSVKTTYFNCLLLEYRYIIHFYRFIWYPVTLLNPHIITCDFFFADLRFFFMSPTNKHLWFLGDNFFFLTIPFISFSWVTALDSISSTMLSLIAASRYLSLVCNLRWRHSIFYCVSCVFFIRTLNPVLEFSSVPNLLRLLSWMGIWFLSNASSMFICSVLFFFFSYFCWCGFWIAFPVLYILIFELIMMYHLFKSICWIWIINICLFLISLEDIFTCYMSVNFSILWFNKKYSIFFLIIYGRRVEFWD